ncbi:MAG: ABC transporter substrate-binding protein [Ilumatobacteraceae bacterium]|nr:ABC transporter substrate-binding protein [Ilumatobacter sp.]
MRRPLTALLLVTTVVAAACTDESSDGGTTAPGTEPTTTVIAPDLAMVAGQPIPEARCQANQEAGTIVYLSSFDFAATASIVDVLVAKSKGYYEALCLDVELKPSFSVDNYPQIAANDAQFSSGGSFSEMVDFAGANDAGFVALAVEGRTGIDALITKDGAVPTLADIAGTKIGVKGAITPSVKAMLAQQGLIEGEDYETVLLDGFDPLVHIEVPDIVGFPGYKSNEPLQLEAAGVPFTLYDPSDYGVPGSFGVVYTNDTFLTEHPTAAQDFMRATMRGLADAIADPAGAAEIAVGFIEAGDNIMFLSAESETARWGVESQLVADGVAPGAPLGLPLVDELTAEVTTYASIGLFDGVAPDITTMVDPAVLAGVYDADGTVIWPSGG